LNIHQKYHQLILILYIMLLVITAFIMLYFGLRDKGNFSGNTIEWAAEGKGLQFHRNSFAYTENFSTDDSPGNDGLTIEFVIKPDFFEKLQFSLIIQIYNNSDDSQISIGQWDRSLVILNNDDYSNKRRKPKIYTPPIENKNVTHVSVISDKSGTVVYFNGELQSRNANLIMSLPARTERTHLILGNSIEGKNSWSGTLYALAVHDRALSKNRIEANFQYWTENENLFSSTSTHPQLLYTFERGPEPQIPDYSGNNNNLTLPKQVPILKRDILTIPDLKALDFSTIRSDLLLNYFGFIPLGFLLFMTILKTGSRHKMNIVLSAAFFSFIFSISIELLQVTMPARDSSMLDLFLNTMGGLTGGVIARRFKI
jgi:VanZ like family/Concanavalin A-like lectin/glucanases superfamily